MKNETDYPKDKREIKRPMRVTHQSLQDYDRKVLPVYTECDKSLVCTVHQIQTHTIDKSIVERDYISKEVLREWLHKYNLFKEHENCVAIDKTKLKELGLQD